MNRLHTKLVFALIGLHVILVGCTSDFNLAPLQDYRDVSGRYHSAEPYGTLGILTLQIGLYKDTQLLKAWLAGSDETMGLSEGNGSYGDGHVVLNFDQGFDSDFYFEGVVQVSDGQIQAIVGSFVFPDSKQPVPIRFDFVELVQ